MDAQLLERYADLIVSVGANVQPDQVLAVEALPEAQPLVAAIARRAYEKGARYVDVQYFDGDVKRIRAEGARDGTLDWVPPWLGERIVALGELDAARCVLVPMVPPGLLDGVDPARAGQDRLPTLEETFKTIDDRSIAWTLSPYPTLRWARVVYPGLDPDEALDRLWQDVVHVCRLDEPDPAAAWRARIEELSAVGERLNALELDSLHYEGPGTDLTIGLLPSSSWIGALSTTVDGLEHLPNVPTEEVFTTPDPERAEGHVRSTKPLVLTDGTMVRGLQVRFEGGRAVEITADEGGEVLNGRTKIDDGASRLGEVALVDRESRIGQLGTVFYETLLDENAASHIALGSGFAFAVETDEDRKRVNESAVHIDFMIGSNEVDVTGLTSDGERVPLLRDGVWQLSAVHAA